MGRSVERIKWDPKAPVRAARLAARKALEAGELIALPTETVYGIAARADDEAALERLRSLKGRPAGQALTWHIGDPGALGRFERTSPLASRLIRRYWPGPLTLVLPGAARGVEALAADGWTGVRLPAHAGTAQWLAKLPFPVAASSANLHGRPPLADAAALEAEFGADLALVLDGGPPRMGESSTVLKVGPGHFDLLREGLIDIERLRETAGLSIGFVCTGNTCRSPMAEGIARSLAARSLAVPPDRLSEFGFQFSSMGVFAGAGAPVSENSVRALAQQDIDISQHLSRPVTLAAIAALDRVYALTRSHLDALRAALPPGADRHCDLLDPEGRDVPDPIGGSLADYEETRDRIRAAIEARADDWF